MFQKAGLSILGPTDQIHLVDRGLSGWEQQACSGLGQTASDPSKLLYSLGGSDRGRRLDLLITKCFLSDSRERKRGNLLLRHQITL